MSSLRVSVVITAYNRRNFIYEAIQSLVQQTLNLSMFEVIIISNFNIDTNIFPKSLEMRLFIRDGIVGEFLYEGIKNSKNEIIAFLDDDDTFDPRKLETLIEVFSKNPSIIYYHNGMKYINTKSEYIQRVRLTESWAQLSKKGHLIFDLTDNLSYYKEAIRLRGDFNLSSIAVKREYAEKYLSLLRKIEGLSDGFFFWISLAFQGRLMIDTKYLTNYRIHDSNTSGNLDIKKKINDLHTQTQTFDMILDFINSTYSMNPTYTFFIEWVHLLRCEYALIKYIFEGASKVMIVKLLIRIFLINPRISNTLKYRIIGFASLNLISKRIANRLYLKFRAMS